MPRSRRAFVATGLVALALCTSPPSVAASGDASGFGALLVPSRSWLGGLGVAVYSNGSSRYFCNPAVVVACRSQFGPRHIDVGIKWQCVELAQRLYIARGWYPAKFGVAYAYQIWAAAPRLGMTRRTNGTLTARDLHPGDMIVWRSSRDVGFAGHVAIVDGVFRSQVFVEEQNWGRAMGRSDRQRGRSVYALAGGWLNGHALPPATWLRSAPSWTLSVVFFLSFMIFLYYGLGCCYFLSFQD